MQKVSGQEFYNTSQVDDHICSTCTKLDPLVERALAIPIDIFAAKELNLLHRRGVNLHGTDRHGRSALALAALDGRVVLLNTLMECNGDIQESDHRKWTPLLAATFNRQSQILPNILKFNANINHQSQDGSSALLLAAYNQDEASFYYLLEQGANPLLETSLGNTALKQAVRNKDMNMIRALVHNNAHPETQDKTKQENAFMVAAEVGNIEALQYFITLGVNIDAQDHVGNRALTWAITKNNRPMLQWLIDQNANGSTLWPLRYGKNSRRQ
jgi:ankyrin repeat protein